MQFPPKLDVQKESVADLFNKLRVRIQEPEGSMPTVKVNDAEIYYEVHGQGQPFIFFSETACDGEIWKLFQVPEFSKDHRVIVHDYRGTGRSSKPSIDYTTRMFCDDAVAILDHLNVSDAIVLGHSMGGRVAQLLALEYPERVKKLILASTGASFPGAAGLPLAMCKEMIEWGYEKYVREHTIQVGFTDEFVQRSARPFRSVLPRPARQSLSGGILLAPCLGAPKP